MQRRNPGAVRAGARLGLLLGGLLAATAHAAIVRVSGPDDDHHFGDVGNAESEACRMSHTGQFVLFASHANDLVPDDDNRDRDLFLRDQVAQTTVRLNRSAADAGGDLVGDQHDLSADGSRIVFVSEDLLGSAEPNGQPQVLLLDRGDGSVHLVSRTTAGDPNTGVVEHPRISADGRFVVFAATGTGLVVGVGGATAQIYRYEVATGATVLVSQSSNGDVANGSNAQPTLSGDGSRVAFTTLATNLLTDAMGAAVADGNGAMDVVFKTYPTGRVRLAGVGAAGAPLAAGASDAVVSADGLSIAFTSNDAALRSDPGNTAMQVYVRRLGPGATTEPVSLDAGGAMADGPTRDPDISADGRWVAFLANAPNLDGSSSGPPTLVLRDTATALTSTPGEHTTDGAPALAGDGTTVCKVSAFSESDEVEDNNSAQDVFIHDTGGGGVAVASLATVPTTWAGGEFPGLSADGAVVVFHSVSANIVADLPRSRWRLQNLIRFDIATGARTLVLPEHDGAVLQSSLRDPVLSADGAQLFFLTSDPVLAISGTTLARVDLADGTLSHITPSSDGAGLDGQIEAVRSSGDGRAAAFVSDAANLPGAPPTPPELVYLWREGLGMQIVSRVPGGAIADDDSMAPTLSRDGRCVAFSSDATTLATPALAGYHVYLYRVAEDRLERIDTVVDNSTPVRLLLDADCTTLHVLRASNVAAKGGASEVVLQRYDVVAGIWSDIDTGIADLDANVLSGSGDGRYLLLQAGTRSSPDRLWRFDTQSGAALAVTPLSERFFGEEAAISDDGWRVVFESGDDTLDPFVVDNNGSADVYLAELPLEAVFADGFE